MQDSGQSVSKSASKSILAAFCHFKFNFWATITYVCIDLTVRMKNCAENIIRQMRSGNQMLGAPQVDSIMLQASH